MQTPSRSSIGSLVASARRRRDAADRPSPEPGHALPRLRALAGAGPHLHLAGLLGEAVEGWVFDPSAPARRLVVELVLDGEPAGIARAERFDPDLLAAGIGDGCHGFRFSLDPALLPHVSRVGVRLANDEAGALREIALGEVPGTAPETAGAAEWLGGLCFRGWLPVLRRAGETGEAPLVEGFVDGERVAQTRADGWCERDGVPHRAFLLTLPRLFADGSARSVTIRQGGQALPGSPVAFLAFADGLEAELGHRGLARLEGPRGRLFDLAKPDAVPFSAFEAWEARFFPAPASPRLGRPIALAAIGDAVFDTENEGRTVLLALSPDGAPTRFSPGALARALEEAGAECPFVLFALPGATLRPGALARLASALEAEPGAEIAYGDLLLSAEDGTILPLMLPAFDEERFLEQASAGFAFLMRRGAALKAARRGVGDLLRLFLAPLEGGSGRGLHLHVPGPAVLLPRPDPGTFAPLLTDAVAAHLAERGLAAETVVREDTVLPAIRLRRRTSVRPATTIILDAAHGGLDAALDAIEDTRRRTGAKLLVVARDLREETARRLELDGLQRIEPGIGEGFAARLTRAAESLEAENVLFLDARLRPESADFLDEMTARLRPGTGAVGPVIASAAGLVLSAGLVLAGTGATHPAFADRMAGDAGSGDALRVARQVSALDPRCLLLPLADFLALGGFDPARFPRLGGGTDLCLKLAALGRRIIVTPDAALRWTGPAERPFDAAEARLAERARRTLQARWPEAFACDPCYSPLLQRGEMPYSGLAWPPGPARTRRPGVAPARSIPPGW